MLKPEVIQKMGKILSFIEGKGFKFNRMMLTRLSATRAAEFYKEHNGRPFYEYAWNPFRPKFSSSGNSTSSFIS